MTSEERYLLLIRNIRRRINDMVSESPAPGEQVVFENDDLRDEIDLAVKYIGREDILSVREAQYELIILRVWVIVTKILAFDSSKFFTITQTNQTINKGERTNHYLSVADNLEKLLADAMDKIGDGDKAEVGGDLTVGDIIVLDRDSLQMDTAISDNPPVATFIEAVEKMEVGFVPESGVAYVEGDYQFRWERSNASDFSRYKFYISNNPNVTKDTGRILFSIVNNNIVDCIVNMKAYTGIQYLVMYVVDNRDQYSEPSDVFTLDLNTGSV